MSSRSVEGERRRRRKQNARRRSRQETDNPQAVLKDLELLMARPTNISIDQDEEIEDLTPTLARCRRVILRLWGRTNSNGDLAAVEGSPT